MKFYYTKDKENNPRHVVVATADPVDGTVSVKRVGLHPSVVGTARRGKRPNFDEPVKLGELTEMDLTDVPDDLKVEASRALAVAPADDTAN